MDALYLTAGQCKYLGGLIDAAHSKAPWEPDDTVILNKTDDGVIFVAFAIDLDDEGAGVWVDAAGEEQYGPTSGEYHPEDPNIN